MLYKLMTRTPLLDFFSEEPRVPRIDFFSNFTRNREWVEKDDRWEILIPSPNADIYPTEDSVEVSYKHEKTYDYGKSVVNGSFTASYPDNSVPETIRAKRHNNTVVLSIEKAIKDVKKEEPKRFKLRIE